MRLDAMILVFWMLSVKPAFSLFSFTFLKRLFSSLLSAIRVVASAYLRLRIFLRASLTAACAPCSPHFARCALHRSWVSRVAVVTVGPGVRGGVASPLLVGTLACSEPWQSETLLMPCFKQAGPCGKASSVRAQVSSPNIHVSPGRSPDMHVNEHQMIQMMPASALESLPETFLALETALRPQTLWRQHKPTSLCPLWIPGSWNLRAQ